jgi:hypothetical protein
MTYVLIETAGLDIIDVHVMTDRRAALAAFEAIALANSARIWDAYDLSPEAPGTIAIGGDDAYAVQLIEKEAV